MKKFKVLVIEDDPVHIRDMKTIFGVLEGMIDIERSLFAKTYDSAIKTILSNNVFDFTIIDYKLDQGRNGLALLHETNGYIKNYGDIVFTTIDESWKEKFHQFKIAPLFNFFILDKPFCEKDFTTLLNDIKLHQYSKLFQLDKKRLLNQGNSGDVAVEDVSHILYIEGAKRYSSYFVLEDTVIKKHENVTGTIEQQLSVLKDDLMFLRVHNSYIVNVTKIKRIKDDRNGGTLYFTDSLTSPNARFIARYSKSHPNFQLLQERTPFFPVKP